MKLLLLLPIFIVSLFLIDDAEARSSFIGNFEGKFDEKMINTEGEFRVGGESNIFVFVGTFENAGRDYFNPSCQKISGDLILESNDKKIYIDFDGKNCKYGLISYVVGTFETEGGEGRITFVADHHNNNVKGELRGFFNDIPEQILDDVDISDSVELSIEEDVPQDHKVVINDGMSATGDTQ